MTKLLFFENLFVNKTETYDSKFKKDKFLNAILNDFFSRKITWMFSDLRISDQIKMYFIILRLLTDIKEGSFLKKDFIAFKKDHP